MTIISHTTRMLALPYSLTNRNVEVVEEGSIHSNFWTNTAVIGVEILRCHARPILTDTISEKLRLRLIRLYSGERDCET
jgi:hypothetical protein